MYVVVENNKKTKKVYQRLYYMNKNAYETQQALKTYNEFEL